MIERHIGYLEKFLDILSERQRVLSSNIANADTPGFKARDFDFRAEFRKAMDADLENDAGEGVSTSASPLMFETPAISPSRDGNTVSMEVEMSKMSENTMLYSVMARVISMKLRTVRDAVTGGR